MWTGRRLSAEVMLEIESRQSQSDLNFISLRNGNTVVSLAGCFLPY